MQRSRWYAVNALEKTAGSTCWSRFWRSLSADRLDVFSDDGVLARELTIALDRLSKPQHRSAIPTFIPTTWRIRRDVMNALDAKVEVSALRGIP